MTVYSDISKTYSLLDLGFSKSLTKPDTLLILPLPTTPEMANTFSFGVAGKTITGGELVANLEQQTGVLFSGKTGFNNTTTGYRLGIDSSDSLAKFYIGNATDYLNWTGSALTVAGTFTISGGTIGGWTISATRISAGTGSATVGLDSTVTAGDDIRIFAGNATMASAPFRVTEAGAVTASNITITGGDVAASVLSGTILSARLNLADRGWAQTSAFSVTDADTVSWGAGTFTASDGTAYSIGAGNTGNMAAKTFVYLDIAVSTTAYQTTTTAATAVGAGKVLVAICQNGTGEATFMLINDNAYNIDASNIVALSITANEIAASTITSGKMSVSQLSAIAADMGAITAGTIVMPSGGLIRSGQTAYNTGTGFYLGNDAGTPRFSVGVGTGDRVTWDGTTLTIQGSITVSTTATAGESLAAADAVYIEDSTVVDRTLFTITSTTTNDNYFGRDTISNVANQGRKIGQGVQETTSYVVRKVTVSLAKTGSPTDNAQISLQADSGGNPSGVALASGTIGGGSLTGAATDYTITLSADVTLTANTPYWLVFERTGALSDVDYYNAYGANTDVYSGSGRACKATNASDVWTTDIGDQDYRAIFLMTPVQGRVYKASAAAAGTSDSTLGFVTAAAEPTATATIQTHGTFTGLSGLTVGAVYYISNTNGAIATSAGTVSHKIGIAVTASNLTIANVW